MTAKYNFTQAYMEDGDTYEESYVYTHSDGVYLNNEETKTLSDYIEDRKFENARGTATAITLNVGELVTGYSKTFIAKANNNGSATTINGKPLYKPATTTAPTLKANKAYTVWFNEDSDCFFFKASAEGNATAENVLADKTFSNDDDTSIVGTMPNNGSINKTLVLNGSYTIPKGYHDGTGIVSQNIITQGGQTLPVKLSFTDSYNLDVSIPKGAYFTERPGKQYPEIKIPTNDILNTIGLTGDYIAKPIGGIPAFAKRFKAGESQIHYRQYNSSGFGYQEYFINIDVDFTPMCFLTYEGTPNLSYNFGATCLKYDNKNYNSYTEGRYRKDEGTTYSKYSSTWNSSKRIIVYEYNTYRDYDTEVTDELYRPNNQVASMKWVAFGN